MTERNWFVSDGEYTTQQEASDAFSDEKYYVKSEEWEIEEKDNLIARNFRVDYDDTRDTYYVIFDIFEESGKLSSSNWYVENNFSFAKVEEGTPANPITMLKDASIINNVAEPDSYAVTWTEMKQRWSEISGAAGNGISVNSPAKVEIDWKRIFSVIRGTVGNAVTGRIYDALIEHGFTNLPPISRNVTVTLNVAVDLTDPNNYDQTVIFDALRSRALTILNVEVE